MKAFVSKTFVAVVIVVTAAHLVLGMLLYRLYTDAEDVAEEVAPLPGLTSTTAPPPDAPAANQDFQLVPPGGSQRTVHVVAAGESFWKIAQRYGISPQQLMRHNGLTSNHVLKVGEKLHIPPR